MPSVSTDSRRHGAAGIVLAVLLALLTGCSGDVSITPPTPTRDDAASRAGAAQRALSAFADELEGSGPAGSGRLRAAVDNGRALGVRDVRLHYVDENLGALDDAARARFGAGAWVASVQVGYRLAVDTGTTRMTTAFTFVPDGDGARIGAIGGYGERSPLWMRGPAAVRRTGRVTVVAAGRDADTRAETFSGLGRRALADVHAVLPAWSGPLVLDVPRSEAELDAVLDAEQQTYADIAAVTTTVDGSLDPGSPVHVFVNPAVFDGLRRQGAQVVISHEATHVATDGPFSDMPTWLLEGFADYVALAHAGVPVQTAAAQVLTRIRAHGLPEHLPTAADLQPTANGLGATYEEAWLACRYLAQTYGEAALVRFYDTVRGGTSLGAAFQQVLGVTKRQFVQGWRAELSTLARG